MHNLCPRRLIPSLLTNGRGRYLSSGRSALTLARPERSDDDDVSPADTAVKSRQNAPPMGKTSTKSGVIVLPEARLVKNTERDEDRYPVRMLRQLLAPGTERVIRSHIPLEAAAEIVMKVRSVPEGIPTPPSVVTEVLKIAECASRDLTPWPLAIICKLATFIRSPGVTPNADTNGDLIARLLMIARGDADGPYGYYDTPNRYLLGVFKSRGRTILLTDYSAEARTEYARLVSTGALPPHIFKVRMTSIIDRECSPTIRDILCRKCLEDFRDMYIHCTGDLLTEAALSLGYSYALGDILPRDGHKAKRCWEYAVIHGLVTGSNSDSISRPVADAAFHLACIHLGKQPEVYGNIPLFNPNISRALQYLHVIKSSSFVAARMLGNLYYLDPDGTTTVQEHIASNGVVPNDAVAAEAFCIGAERLDSYSCRIRFAELLYMKRAHPPVESSLVKAAAVPQIPLSSHDVLASLGDLFDDEFGLDDAVDRLLSMFDLSPSIEFAPRSRRDTLIYAWQLVEPIQNNERRGRFQDLHIYQRKDAVLDLIREEAQSEGIELVASKQST